MELYKKLPRKLRLAILVLFILPTVLFFLVSFFLLIYAFAPLPLTPPEITSAPKMTIIAHGLRDTPDGWSENLAEIINNSDSGYSATALDWSEDAKSIFRCSVNGFRLGKKIGRELAHDKNLHVVHLVGHSCGAFVVRGVCLGLKEERKDIMVQTTFLDPVSNYGGVIKNFGTRVFGSCGDKSEAYIDTGDSVPGSNQPLSQGVTYDVTPMRYQSAYSGNPHLWPVVYYTDLVESGRVPLL